MTSLIDGLYKRKFELLEQLQEMEKQGSKKTAELVMIEDSIASEEISLYKEWMNHENEKLIIQEMDL